MSTNCFLMTCQKCHSWAKMILRPYLVLHGDCTCEVSVIVHIIASRPSCHHHCRHTPNLLHSCLLIRTCSCSFWNVDDYWIICQCWKKICLTFDDKILEMFWEPDLCVRVARLLAWLGSGARRQPAGAGQQSSAQLLGLRCFLITGDGIKMARWSTFAL